MTHLKWNKYSDVLSICSFIILTRIYVFLFYLRRQNSPYYYTCSRLLFANIEIKLSSSSPFSSNFNLLNVIFMFKEMSWFVKNEFNNVYPCISKIWTVSKLVMLIKWLPNTDCVDKSHLQIVNYRWFKMFIWFETNEEWMNEYCFMAHRQLRSFSAQLNLIIHDPWVNKLG